MQLYISIPLGSGWQPISHPAGFSLSNTPTGALINRLLPYLFTLTGIILLFMIISAGYSLLTSAGNPEGIEKGKKRLTAGLTGFVIVFAAFWIWQLVAFFLGGGLTWSF